MQLSGIDVIFKLPYALSARILLPSMLTFDSKSKAQTQSCSLPAVSAKYMGLPKPSTIAWILVVLPPRLLPIC